MRESSFPDVKPHRANAGARGLMICGGTFVAIGALGATVAASQLAAALSSIVGGALMIAGGVYTRYAGAGAHIVNKAGQLTLAGHLAEAEALLDHLERTCRIRHLRRAADFLRAMVAMRRGDLGRALRHADAAIARPPKILIRHIEQVQIAHARGMRALLHAALGERASAQEDIAWVKAAQESTPEALAKAALAEAVLLERAGNLEGLRGLLAQNRSLLLENPSPRERALVRAYQRMLKANAKPSSVYRASAPKEGPPENEKPGLADWISKIAPSAAPFAGAPREREAGFAAGASSENILSPPHEEALKSAEARKAAFKSRATKGVKLVLLSYAGCIVMFLAIWKFLQPDPKTSRAPVVHRPAPPPPAGEPNLLLSLVLPLAVTIALVIGIFALQMRKVRQTTRALVAARVSIARGDVSAGALALEDLSKSRYRGPAAEAHLVLARLAESHGELDKALRYCEAAIAMFPGEGDRAAANVVFPSLLAERAFLFAAKGRSADASAEMDLLTQSYPSFTEQRGAAVRVALAQHLQRGDFEAAARLANQCPDLSVFARDELLADLALVVAHPSSTSVEEVERLEDELRDPKVCRFIAAVSPSLMEAFQRARRNLHADGETPARDHQAAEEVPAMT